MTHAATLQLIGAALFALAILHTFSTKFFEHLAHQSRHHARFWHLMGEVEIVFGLWAMVLICFMFALYDKAYAIRYLEDQDFTEPLFVFVIMVISASKPVFDLCSIIVLRLSAFLPSNRAFAQCFIILSVVPLLGSFITEPAAMTLAALLLKRDFYDQNMSPRMMYATISVLFVNISIGGTLTPYAAPPILMVATQWNWDMSFMLNTFGWRSGLAAVINALAVSFIFSNELKVIKAPNTPIDDENAPFFATFIHLFFLVVVVYFSHYPVIFIGLFLLFVGFTEAYDQYQNKLKIRESLLVAFFWRGWLFWAVNKDGGCNHSSPILNPILFTMGRLL
jgi:Putative Na+/H+ antiporter